MKTKIQNNLVVIIIVACLVTGVKCNNSLTPPIDETRPGSRNYIWTVDTLKLPPGAIINLKSLWGSGASDVWAVGEGDAARNCVWHYDGVSWKNYGMQLSPVHFSVFGFAQNNVWMVDAPNGESIWHYDGIQWNLFGTYPRTGESILDMQNVWGDAPNNIYAVGFDNIPGNLNHVVVMHFDGKMWKYYEFPSINNVSLNRIRRDSQTGKYYLSGMYFGINEQLNKAYEYDGQNQMTEIFSGPIGAGLVGYLNGRVYFSGAKQITRYVNNRFEVVNDLSSSSISIGVIWGRTERDIFAQAFEGKKYGIGHYNGTDWKMLYSYEPTAKTPYFIDDMAILDSTIFVLMTDLSHTWIVKGKLTSQN